MNTLHAIVENKLINWTSSTSSLTIMQVVKTFTRNLRFPLPAIRKFLAESNSKDSLPRRYFEGLLVTQQIGGSSTVPLLGDFRLTSTVAGKCKFRNIINISNFQTTSEEAIHKELGRAFHENVRTKIFLDRKSSSWKGLFIEKLLKRTGSTRSTGSFERTMRSK